MVYQDISSKSPLTLSNTILKNDQAISESCKGFSDLLFKGLFLKLAKNIGLPGKKFPHFYLI
jgi:hypothetical protein